MLLYRATYSFLADFSCRDLFVVRARCCLRFVQLMTYYLTQTASGVNMSALISTATCTYPKHLIRLRRAPRKWYEYDHSARHRPRYTPPPPPHQQQQPAQSQLPPNTIATGAAPPQGTCSAYGHQQRAGDFNVAVGEGSFHIEHTSGETIDVRNLGSDMVDIVNIKENRIKALAVLSTGPVYNYKVHLRSTGICMEDIEASGALFGPPPSSQPLPKKSTPPPPSNEHVSRH